MCAWIDAVCKPTLVTHVMSWQAVVPDAAGPSRISRGLSAWHPAKTSCSRMSCNCSSKLLRTDALSSPTPLPGPPPGDAADDADASAGLMASSPPFAFLTAGVEGTSSSAPSAPRLIFLEPLGGIAGLSVSDIMHKIYLYLEACRISSDCRESECNALALWTLPDVPERRVKYVLRSRKRLSGQMQYKSEARKHVSQQSRTSRSVLYPSALHGPSGHSQDSGPRILEPRQWGETDLDIGTHRTTQSAGLPTQAVAAARAERRRWGRSRWGGGPLTSKNASSDAAN